MSDARAPFDPSEFEYRIMDAKADVTALDLILEVAIPDFDASESLGLERNPDLHRVVMTYDLHRALMRAVLHVRKSVETIHNDFQNGGFAAMQRGVDAERKSR